MARKRKNTCAVAVDRQLEMSARQTDRLASETPEQRQIRLQSMSASNAVRLASKTPEQRQIRLQSMSARNAVRVALIQRNFLFSATKGAQNFMNTIIMSTCSSENILFCSNGRYNRSQYTIQLAYIHNNFCTFA